jgi:Fe-S oxidoreductase
VLFYDTYINYNDPNIGFTIIKLFENNGYNVIIPKQQSSGLPAIVEGNLDVARKIANYNIDNLSPYAEEGIPIVTFSPSAGVALKMEYLSVIDTPKSRVVSDLTYDIHEFLYSIYKKGELNKNIMPVNMNIYLHLHCHDIVQRIDQDITNLIGLIPKLKFERLEEGCCGIGGAFGFVKGNFDKSMKIGKPLIDAVKSSNKPVYSTGESCTLQMETGSNKKIGLTIDLLREAYGFN